MKVPSGLDGSLQYRVILLRESTDRGLWLSIRGGRGSAEPWGTSFAHWRRARLKGANGKQLRSFRAGIQPNPDYALAQSSTALHVCVCLCFCMVTIVQKLHRRQSRVMMHGVTLGYNNRQSGASQLLSTAIIFLILSNRKTEFN